MILASLPHPFAYCLILGYLLRTPDNSTELFLISLEGARRELSGVECVLLSFPKISPILIG